MKHCIKCKEDKELSEFHKNHKSKDKHHSYCKSCNTLAAMLVAKKNKDKINAKRRERRNNEPEFRDKINKYKMNAYWTQREVHLLRQAKQALKRRNIECTIDIKDIVIPIMCPIFNIPLDKGRFAPSLDRIDNSKGYIPGNVWVISRLANTMKNDGSIKELLTFCENLPKYIKEYDIV